MNNWKDRLTIGSMSFPASAAVWAVVLLALLLLAISLYASAAGTQPGNEDFFFNDRPLFGN